MLLSAKRLDMINLALERSKDTDLNVEFSASVSLSNLYPVLDKIAARVKRLSMSYNDKVPVAFTGAPKPRLVHLHLELPRQVSVSQFVAPCLESYEEDFRGARDPFPEPIELHKLVH